MPRPDWIKVYIKACEWPDDWQTSLALDLWHQSEGTPDNWNNPMAMGAYRRFRGDPMYGCYAPAQLPDGSDNVDNVLRCPNELEGAAEFAANMQRDLYKWIDAAFKLPVTYQTKLLAIYKGINDSPWCPHCQQGRYPFMLHDYIFGRNPPKFDPGLVTYPARQQPRVPTTLIAAWHQFTRQFRVTVPKQIRRIDNATREMALANRKEVKRGG